jgi:hypothetical protein
MHAITRLNDVIRSSRQRMQAGQSRNVEKSARLTGETKQRKKPKAEHTSTAQPRYIDSGDIKLTPR